MEEQKKKIGVADILCTIIHLIVYIIGLITIKLVTYDDGFFDVFKAYLKHHYWNSDTRKMKCEITYSDDEEDDI